jgi:hypothetical protein
MTAEMYAYYERSFHCLRIATEQALRCAEQCIVPCPYEPSADCRDIFNYPVRDIRDIPDACLPHSTSSDTPVADASAPPISDATRTHRAYCEYLDRCYPEAFEMYPTGTLTGCLSVPECQQWYSFWLQTPECREFLDGDACTIPLARTSVGNMLLNFPADSPCAAPTADYSGLDLAAGERCLGGAVSCDQGLYCQLDVPAAASGSYFCGTCTPLMDPDERDEGLPSGPPLTIDGHALGEPCDAVGFPCIQDVTLACVNGRCVNKPDEGDACDDSFQDCRIGQGCDAGRCVALACIAEPSGFCGGATRCPSGWYCGADQHCARLPGPGESCSKLGSCGANLVCLDDRCIEPPSFPNGTACRKDVQCRSGRCLRDLTPHCDVNPSDYTCSIPPCETDCGVCGDEPGVAGCQ